MPQAVTVRRLPKSLRSGDGHAGARSGLGRGRHAIAEIWWLPPPCAGAEGSLPGVDARLPPGPRESAAEWGRFLIALFAAASPRVSLAPHRG